MIELRCRSLNFRIAWAVLLVAAVSLGAFGTPAPCAIYTWTGTGVDTHWSTAGNWDASPISASTTTIRFTGDYDDSTRFSNQDVGDPFQLNRLEFPRKDSDLGVLSIDGAPLEFAANGSVQPTLYSPRVRSVTIANSIIIPDATTLTMEFQSNTLTLSGKITGAGALVLNTTPGGGGYVLSNSDNDFTGGLSIYSDSGWYRKTEVIASGAMGGGMVNLHGGTLTDVTQVGGLVFYGTTEHSNPISLHVDSPISAGRISGGTSQVTLHGDIHLNSYTLHLRGKDLGTVAGTIHGSGGIIKRDNSTWVLSGNNTYTGATAITGGVLSVNTLADGGAASSIGQSTNAAANLTFSDGTLRYTGATASTDRRFTIAANGNATFDVVDAGTTLTFRNVAGSSFGTGSVITKDGPGTLEIAAVNGASGYISTVGAFVIKEGRLGTPAGAQINAGRVAADGPAITMGDGTELSLGTALSNLTPNLDQIVRYIGTTSTATISSHVSTTSPYIVFSGPDDSGGTGLFNTKTFNIDDGAAEIDMHLSCRIAVWGGASGAVPVSHLVKTGPGTLKLSYSGTSGSLYRGETIVRDGRLVVGANAPSGAAGALGETTSAVRMGDGDTPAGAALALVTDGALTIGRDVDVHDFGATTTLGGISDHTSTFAGTVTLYKDVALTSVATGANATVFSGPITGSGGIVKTGAGVVTFAGEKTYAGNTVVSMGTLALSHAGSSNNVAASSLVQVGLGAALDVTSLVDSTFAVAAGQTLAGAGKVVGATTITDGGKLAPEMSDEGLIFTGDLAFEGGAVWEWDFLNNTAGAYDRVTGPSLILPTDGTVELYIAGVGNNLSAGDSFILFDGDVFHGLEQLVPGAVISDLFTITDSSGWWGDWEVRAGSLTLTAVPEPGTWLLLLSALVGGLSWRRRM